SIEQPPCPPHLSHTMHPFPHHYRTVASATQDGLVQLGTESAPTLETSAPPEFGGPPGYWSPETLLVGAIADCYILTFRAVARASRLEWRNLAVEVEGVLDRVEGVTRFVRFTLKPRLEITAGASDTLARTVLEKAKRGCLVTNSLNAECTVEPTVLLPESASASPMS
ncbi:MAG TPA: OsmC family protein, partial [Ramlibacter sp.]|uniref:OsmC family protein n=1 Tax=Ramlibacter sp. TaxID=1917967 RepID=UPI002D7EFE4D